jgi:hypothetical protein
MDGMRLRWDVSKRVGRLLLIGGIIVVVAILAGEVSLLQALTPHKRAVAQLRNPMPLDQAYAEIDRVSHWPADWINSVCEPPLYRLRNYKRLPDALSNASCQSRTTGSGDLVNYLIISRFPSELAMQVDLSNEGYKWYAFTFDHGSLVSFATASDDPGVTGTNGLSEIPVLQPLKQFGFSIYSRPGPP